jgi:dTDP-4-amino-4,6-dideoxygalactose transaminase
VQTTQAPPRAPVPFFDLAAAHRSLRATLLEEIGELIDSGAFTNGPQVASFEAAFAAYCGRAYCVGVGSGLDALRLALLGAGIEPGAEVIVPAATFVATFEAVTQAGATPVVVDVSETDYGLDPDAAAAAAGSRTFAILPVHLYGQLADVGALSAVAKRAGCMLLEDACQAHGAQRAGIRAGAAGDAAAFSFYPAKNLGAFGDAGALVTDDPELARTVRALREHGQHAKYEHALQGYTARLDTLQALVLAHKLPLLDGWNEERRRAAAFYCEALAGVGDLRLPPVPEGSEPAWHLFVVRTRRAAELAEQLAACGIGSGRHYPQPPHLARAYAALGHRPGDFPVAEGLARECLSLPLFPGMAPEQLLSVVTAVDEFFSGGRRPR